MPVEELAAGAGLTVEQVRRICESENIPSLSSLIKIARALGVRLGTFLDDYEEMGGPVVTRNSDLMTPVTFTSQMANSNSHMDFISLAPGKAGRNMDRSLSGFRLPQVMRVSLHMKGGKSFFMCVEGGLLRVYYGKENIC